MASNLQAAAKDLTLDHTLGYANGVVEGRDSVVEHARELDYWYAHFHFEYSTSISSYRNPEIKIDYVDVD